MSPTADAEVSRPYLPLNNNPNSLWVVPALLLQVDYKPISAYIYELAHIPGADQRVSGDEGDEGSNRSAAGNGRSNICNVLSHGLNAPNM